MKPNQGSMSNKSQSDAKDSHDAAHGKGGKKPMPPASNSQQCPPSQ